MHAKPDIREVRLKMMVALAFAGLFGLGWLGAILPPVPGQLSTVERVVGQPHGSAGTPVLADARRASGTLRM